MGRRENLTKRFCGFFLRLNTNILLKVLLKLVFILGTFMSILLGFSHLDRLRGIVALSVIIDLCFILYEIFLF